MHHRARNGIYDFEAGVLPLSSPDFDDERKGHRRKRSWSPKNAATGLFVFLVVVFMFMPRKPSSNLPQNVPAIEDFIEIPAHDGAAQVLHTRLLELVDQTRKRVANRKNRKNPPKIVDNLTPMPRPLYRGPKRVDDGPFISATISDAALGLLTKRVEAAEREAKRQEHIDGGPWPERQAFQRNNGCGQPLAGKKRGSLRVATVNLLQPGHKSWPQRKVAIATLLSSLDVDVVALQEVRGGGETANDGYNWAHQLADEIDKSWNVRYVPGTGAGTLTHGGSAPPGWTEEGVALISRFELDAYREELVGMPPLSDSADKNPRVTLGAVIRTPIGDLRVVASHLSYDRQQQCRAVGDRLQPWLDRLWVSGDRESTVGQLLLGDLNIYPDFEWPLDELQHGKDVYDALRSPCQQPGEKRPKKEAETMMHETDPLLAAAAEATTKDSDLFVDVWTATKTGSSGSGVPGWTFPNPEKMNLDPARPDRLLLRSTQVKPVNAAIYGCESIQKDPEKDPTYLSDHRLVVVDFVNAT